jgi:hypothetical protein
VGGTAQMTATGYFSGGSVLDLTSLAKWQATPKSIAIAGNWTSQGGALRGRPSVACVPSSGSFFPRGTTLVTCTATDACGNQSAGQFPVTVQIKARRR